jgi:hypothetical protein
MTEISDWLKAADPLAEASPRSAEEVARLRATTMSAAVEQVNTRRTWPGASMVAATIVMVFAATAWFERPPVAVQQATLAPTVDRASATEIVPASAGAAGVRQLQFATAGGTRIIWVFNPEFRLRGE